MIPFLSIMAVGFFLGMRHATDPDHVIAVSTIVTRNRNLGRAALIGAFWGLGHTITIFAVGTGIILFNLVIPARVGLSMEVSVGIMLIILGVMNVMAFLRAVRTAPDGANEDVHDESMVHSHRHSHGGIVHSHLHTHEPAQSLALLDRSLARFDAYQHLRPLAVGIVHGLAGSAAVALLVLATIRDARWAVAYLLVFGVGTIAGMMVITMSLATTLKFAGRRQSMARKLAMASGLLSLGFGFFVVYQMGFVSGLFTGHPLWTPK